MIYQAFEGSNVSVLVGRKYQISIHQQLYAHLIIIVLILIHL